MFKVNLILYSAFKFEIRRAEGIFNCFLNNGLIRKKRKEQ